jgi:hypothetical protein
MGEITFVTFDSDKGAPTASISGSPVDVADFLAIWMKNQDGGISLAKQLGVKFNTSDDASDL